MQIMCRVFDVLSYFFFFFFTMWMTNNTKLQIFNKEFEQFQ